MENNRRVSGVSEILRTFADLRDMARVRFRMVFRNSSPRTTKALQVAAKRRSTGNAMLAVLSEPVRLLLHLVSFSTRSIAQVLNLRDKIRGYHGDVGEHDRSRSWEHCYKVLS